MKTTAFSVFSASLAMCAAGQGSPSVTNTVTTTKTTTNPPSNTSMSSMSNNNDMKTQSTSMTNDGQTMCSDKVAQMGINQLTNGKFLSTCSGGISMSVNNISHALKLPADDRQRICSSSACMAPFQTMESASEYQNCLVMYDGKPQNLAEHAKMFVNGCSKQGSVTTEETSDKESLTDSKVKTSLTESNSNDTSTTPDAKESASTPVAADTSSAAFHSLSAVCLAVAVFVIAIQ